MEVTKATNRNEQDWGASGDKRVGDHLSYSQSAQWNYICKIKTKAKPPGDWPYQPTGMNATGLDAKGPKHDVKLIGRNGLKVQ